MVVFLFTLGNSSNTFILLKAKHVGFNATNVILLYFIYNMTASISSIPFSKLSDCTGRKRLLVPGYLVFSLFYLSFAFTSKKWMIVIAFVIYGTYTAMIAGFLWNAFGAAVAFVFGATISFAAILILIFS